MRAGHLCNTAPESGIEVSYWRERDAEVDFVLSSGAHVTAIEVKTTSARRLRGLDAFKGQFPRSRTLVVGSGGVGLDEILSSPASRWLG